MRMAGCALERLPSGTISGSRDAGTGAWKRIKLCRRFRCCDDVAHISPFQTVLEVLGAEERSGRNEYRTQFQYREQNFPKLRLVSDYDQDVIATPDTQSHRFGHNAVETGPPRTSETNQRQGANRTWPE